jgi:hypothetical protein
MNSYNIVRKNGLAWIEFPKLASFPGIIHFSTTRLGGVSNHPQSSLNMGFVRTDFSNSVTENRKRLAQALRIPFEHMFFSRQTHSDHVHIVTRDDAGKGLWQKPTAIQDNDAYIVTESGLMPVVLTADCVPILLYDAKNKIAAAIHSGWRGTVQQITAKVIQRMVEMGSHPKHLYAAIGPSAGPCCYWVGEEVYSEFLNSFGTVAKSFFSTSTPPYTLDLWKANEYLLKESGIPSNHTEIAGLCTICNPHLFFSSRNNLGMTGRMATGIMLTDK